MMESDKRIKIMQRNMNKMMTRIRLLERIMKQHGWEMPLIEPQYEEEFLG